MMYKPLRVSVLGGGLAGLVAAIHLQRSGMQVTVYEKHGYPRHKVCGEYISNEVRPYLKQLGLDIDSLNPVSISTFKSTTLGGQSIEANLPLGGFGLSRYTLDHYLWRQAEALGCQMYIDQVQEVVPRVSGSEQSLCFDIQTSHHGYGQADIVIGAYGKRSTLAHHLEVSGSKQKHPWLAVKGHYQAKIDSKAVQLHHFEGGYCGISQVEDHRVNVCYLVHYDRFKSYKNINDFQQEVMGRNPALKRFFAHAKPCFKKPMTIAQLDFSKKPSVQRHVLHCGDAAGLIHPLCGNGMAMAIGGAELVSRSILAYHSGGRADRKAMEQAFSRQWNRRYHRRLRSGRWLQGLLLHSGAQRVGFAMAKTIPALVPVIIKKTHGRLDRGQEATSTIRKPHAET